ncbi:hypothetical protein CDL15_Pgr024241 [Punica granatum]|uniref:Heparanase-like protein 2 n=1 Tax=Punica granatum TaxID=22663 RepID=A0A218XWZ5_PUNGR|nr:hypothetical protein CDL15_Pgr024241 [Punica granatum]
MATLTEQLRSVLPLSFLLLLSLWTSVSCSGEAEEVKVRVRGVTSIATTDDNFVCATLDWWPANKCDYGQCPWGQAGLFNLDLNNKILTNAIKAFKPLRIRVGGSLQDLLLYNVGKNPPKKCPHFKRRSWGMFGFSKGCLHMDRWDELNQFFNQTGAKITFGLNALMGRRRSKDDREHFVGNWDPQNARDFMSYTISKGYEIDSYELGNELCGSGVSGRIDADQYGKDMITLNELVKELYPNGSQRPKVLGPAGFFDRKWFETFLQISGPNVVHGLTHHIYNLGAGVDLALIDKIQDPYFLDQVAQTYRNIWMTTKTFGPWAGAWVGESGGAYNSGGKDVSHTFVDGFCALLWHRLMGKEVLSTTHDGSPYLRAYSHCSKNKDGGVSMILINMSNSTSFDVSIINDMNFYLDSHNKEADSGPEPREEYHLTPEGGNIQSDVVLLNGTPLKLTESQDIPEMNPKLANPSYPIHIAPDSIVFVTLKGFRAPACVEDQ